MGALEIALLVIGAVIFALGYLLPVSKKEPEEDLKRLSEEQIKDTVNKELENAKAQIGDIVEETITYAMEKTERSMDRLSNEKIMAVNEYSDTVLNEINKNHKEVIFLYDMLNDKHENLKGVVTEATKTAKEVKQTVKQAQEAAEILPETNAGTVAKPVEAVTARPMQKADSTEMTATVSGLAQVDFQPIHAKRVEVLVQPDGEPTAMPEVKAGTPPKTGGTRNGSTKSARNMGKAEAGEVELHFTSSQPPTGGRNSNERILELHKEGKSNMAIAKELGLGIGEVKLVIDLFEGV